MTSSRTGTGIMQDDPRASCARSYESAGKKKKTIHNDWGMSKGHGSHTKSPQCPKLKQSEQQYKVVF